MNRGIWTILGIEATTDVKRIKQAYANASKQYHPEEYPEEFKRLQNAYKAAIQYSKSNKENDEKSREVVSKNIIFEEMIPKNTVSQNVILEDVPVIKTEIFDYEEIISKPQEDWFWKQLDYLCWHPYARKNNDFWNYFLNQPSVLDLMRKEDFQKRFQERLKCENFIWEKNVRKLLDTYLNNLVTEKNKSELNWASKNLKPGLLHDILGSTMNGYDTKNEQKTYQTILWTNYQNSDESSPAGYLKRYFTYAELHQERLKEIHREAHAVRRGRPLIRILFFIVLILLFLSYQFSKAYDIYEDLNKTSSTIQDVQNFNYFEKYTGKMEKNHV